MSVATLSFPIQAVPVADWQTIAARFAASVGEAGLSIPALAAVTQIPASDITAFSSGDPVLGTYELEQLAQALGLTVGTWFCADQKALFRGAEDGTSAAAAELGVQLMTEYLAVEALAA